MNDSYTQKVHQSYMVTDLTFTQPTVIRPGMLRPRKLRQASRVGTSSPSSIATALDRTRGMRNAPAIRPLTSIRAQRLHEHRSRSTDNATLHGVRAAVIPAMMLWATVFHAVTRTKNWQALISDKHKRYTADRGLEVRPATFRVQAAALVVASVLLLGTAQTAAPSSPGFPQPQPSPLTITSPAELSGDTMRSASDSSSRAVTADSGADTAAENSSWTPISSQNSTDSGSVPAAVSPPAPAENTQLVPTVPGMGSGDLPIDPSIPSTPVEPPTVPIIDDPLPIQDPVPSEPVPSEPGTVQVILDGVTGVLTDAMSGLDSL